MILGTKSHKDPEKIDLNVPRRAQYLHNAWKRHQDAVYWVDINLAIRKGLTFYQTRSNAIILQGILPAYCIPNVVRLKTGEVLYEEAYMSPRPPPKISLRHDHDWTRGNVPLGSTFGQKPEGKELQFALGGRCPYCQVVQVVHIPATVCPQQGARCPCCAGRERSTCAVVEKTVVLPRLHYRRFRHVEQLIVLVMG